MMYAARRGNLEICDYLLEFGADLNHATAEDQFTALHLAAGNELTDICIALIKAGANPHAKDSSGKTPLDYFKIPRNKEKVLDTMDTTYKLAGKTHERIHHERVEAGTEKSVSLALQDRYKSTKDA